MAAPSEHISYDHVEQLAKQEEELIEEVAKVQQILKEFQDKVGLVVHLAPEVWMLRTLNFCWDINFYFVAWDEPHASVGGSLG